MLGKGGFGSVYRGTYNEQDVAIKTFTASAGMFPYKTLRAVTHDVAWLKLFPFLPLGKTEEYCHHIACVVCLCFVKGGDFLTDHHHFWFVGCW